MLNFLIWFLGWGLKLLDIDRATCICFHIGFKTYCIFCEGIVGNKKQIPLYTLWYITFFFIFIFSIKRSTIWCVFVLKFHLISIQFLFVHRAKINKKQNFSAAILNMISTCFSTIFFQNGGFTSLAIEKCREKRRVYFIFSISNCPK
jgi:hypothetical protein